MSDPVLSKLEIRAATRGRTHWDAQVRYLRDLGVTVKVVLRGRKHEINVSRVHFEAVMAGRHTETAANEPDAEAYDRVDAPAIRRRADAKRRA